MKVKRTHKMPMLLICLTTAMMGSISLVLYKSFGEIVSAMDGTLSSNVGFCISLCLGAFCCAVLQIYLLNLNLKYFNNLDLMPVYQASILICNMVCGLVLLNEIANYTAIDLLQLFGSVCFVAAGIWVMTLKRTEIVQRSGNSDQVVDEELTADDPTDFEENKQLSMQKALL